MTGRKTMILDIDGTLVRGNSSLDINLVARINSARTLGWLIILATGRRLVDIVGIRALLKPHFTLTSEGSTISNETDILRQFTLPRNTISTVIENGARYGLTPILCCEDRAYVYEWSPAVDRAIAMGVSKPHIIANTFTPEMVTLVLLVTANVGLLPIGLPEQVIDSCEASSSVSAPGMISVNLPSVNKGSAFDWVLEHVVGVERSEIFVLAAGNSDNDATLAARSDFFIAMADGTPGIRAAANVIAPTIENGGIVEILGNIMLKY